MRNHTNPSPLEINWRRIYTHIIREKKQSTVIFWRKYHLQIQPNTYTHAKRTNKRNTNTCTQRIRNRETQARLRNQQIHTIDLRCASRAYFSHFTLFAHSTEAFKGCKFTVNTYISCTLRAVRSSRYHFDWC